MLCIKVATGLPNLGGPRVHSLNGIVLHLNVVEAVPGSLLPIALKNALNRPLNHLVSPHLQLGHLIRRKANLGL